MIRQGIAKFDVQADPAGGCRQMSGKIQRLISTSDHLRDTLDRAGVELAREENRLAGIADAQRRDPMTGCLSRAALEADMATLRDADPARSRRLCAAMLDIDRFGKINEQFGSGVGDQVLGGSDGCCKRNRQTTSASSGWPASDSSSSSPRPTWPARRRRRAHS